MRRLCLCDEEKVTSSKSEFPVFDWFRAAWDGAIFLSWFIGILVSVVALIGGSMGYGGLMQGIAAGVTVLVYFYFAVIGMSLLKEGLILVLSIALNMERLVNKS